MAKVKVLPPARAGKKVASAEMRKLVVQLVAVLVVGTGVVGGIWALKRHVETTVAFPAEPPTVVLKNRPAWMSDFLYEQIAASVQPTGSHSAFDHQLLVDTTDLLERNPWVAKVNHVRRAFGKKPGDTLEIDCEFRAPVGLVKWNQHYWLVDNRGVKLPEQYTAAQVPKVVLTPDKRPAIRVIEGVRNPPPDAGKQWPGEDLTAGLDMIKLLFNQPYANDVVKVNVANHQGRVDVREAQVVLVTKYGTEVRWGRPVNASDYFIEVPTARKLEYLQTIYQKYGRLDAKQPWIDIRFDNITYPSADTQDATADVRR